MKNVDYPCLNELNKKILNLHKDFSDAINEQLRKVHPQDAGQFKDDLLPMFHDEFDGGGNKILISGINPSFSDLHHGRLDQNIFNTKRFWALKPQEKQCEAIQELIRIQRCLMFGNDPMKQLEQIDYFKKAEHFAANVGYQLGWDHLDIFPHRYTKQKYFLKAINNIDSYKNAALEIFTGFLEAKKYKVVCIFNGGSCNILLSKRNKILNLEPIKIGLFRNRKYGFYKALIGSHEQKFFLYKVISGQGQPGQVERKEMFDRFRKHL